MWCDVCVCVCVCVCVFDFLVCAFNNLLWLLLFLFCVYVCVFALSLTNRRYLIVLVFFCFLCILSFMPLSFMPLSSAWIITSLLLIHIKTQIPWIKWVPAFGKHKANAILRAGHSCPPDLCYLWGLVSFFSFRFSSQRKKAVSGLDKQQVRWLTPGVSTDDQSKWLENGRQLSCTQRVFLKAVTVAKVLQAKVLSVLPAVGTFCF